MGHIRGKAGKGRAEIGGGVGEAIVVIRLESSAGQRGGSRDAGGRMDLEGDLVGLGSRLQIRDRFQRTRRFLPGPAALACARETRYPQRGRCEGRFCLACQ